MARRRVRAESRTRYFIRLEAQRRGWSLEHVGVGGDALEENEIVGHLPDIGLDLDKPDFLFCLQGEPVMVVEAKNEVSKLSQAIAEAVEYAEQINEAGRYTVDIAVGAAGEQDTGFLVEARYRVEGVWTPLRSHGFPITTIPSVREVELALDAADGTTAVSVPASHEFIDAALELSSLLRSAKVEAPLRPKVIGALVVAMYQGEVDVEPAAALDSINRLTTEAIGSADDLAATTKALLIDALTLSSADFDRLAPAIRRVVAILRRLNVRSVLQTDTDFLGLFYEAFLRYGYDNKALGIVFTPRHITRFCASLLEPSARDRVIDIASGTGGFLVAAFDLMLQDASSPQGRVKVKDSISGFETNPTVWALSVLNMFFRGDGKSHMTLGSCFSPKNRSAVARKFTQAYLNPPFSQEGEPESDFLNAAMDALEPGGELAAVVYAGVFADDLHRNWRRRFLREHSLVAMISLPEDLFYPTAAPTTIVVARAHEPQAHDASVFMGRIWNDGFEKLKSRRVEAAGSQLPEVAAAFAAFTSGRSSRSKSELATTVLAGELLDSEEWSPQQWLPQPDAEPSDFERVASLTLRSTFQAVAQHPDLADRALGTFTDEWAELDPLPTNTSGTVSEFFELLNGRSTGEKNYQPGPIPYVSSGDASNSIIRLVDAGSDEVFSAGGITVTAFGTASLQPWPFVGRGNGGSAVRVLVPRFSMSVQELLWFATQINIQRWRFFYARMAIKSRLAQLVVNSPGEQLPDNDPVIAIRLRSFRDQLNELASLQ